MHRFLEDWFKKISEAPTKDAFLEELVKFGKGLGFDLVSYSYLPKDWRKNASIDNHPLGWVEAATIPLELALKDPLLQLTSASARPVVWNSDLYEESGQMQILERVRHFGFEAGIEIPLHQPDGAIYSLSLARSAALPKNPSELMDVIGRAQLFAQLAVQAAPRLFSIIEVRQSSELVHLTKKEREVLQWTRQGKTAWEISQILSIAERTVNFHIQNILSKFDVASKQMAVFRALELGLID
jgi:DNA-binding CsgD family transcriptional regulator